jgi:hypothetical protein
MKFLKLGREGANVGANISTLLNCQLAFRKGLLPFACIERSRAKI